MLTDIEIAQAAEMKDIREVAAKIGADQTSLLTVLRIIKTESLSL